jgi:hypothetical protein
MSDPTSDTPFDYFDISLYEGDGSSEVISDLNFSPDFVWIKDRDSALSHRVFDSTRGTTKALYTNSAGGEGTEAGSLTSFDSNGFTLGAHSGVNSNGDSFVAWSWLETSGFLDIVQYTGTGSAHAISHNLGVKPGVMIVKRYDSSANNHWRMYHKELTATTSLRISTNLSSQTSSVYWNNTEPTTTQFTVGTNVDVNTNGQPHIAYLFAEVEGYSRFGIYDGNGYADGPFIWCGFKPKYVMVKATNLSNGWNIIDSVRDPYNAAEARLYAHVANVESTGNDILDFVSNGFKIRSGSVSAFNDGSGTFIFLAFAEFPFKYANAR